MGCDTAKAGDLLPVYWFQSTHPHGVRRRQSAMSLPTTCFNPRTRMGCDIRHARVHRHVWRFNPRTRMGCDFASLIASTPLSEFQSTHPHGVRRSVIFPIPSTCEFQSTHPHGVRHRTSGDVQVTQSFNPRTRMGCDACNLQDRGLS